MDELTREQVEKILWGDGSHDVDEYGDFDDRYYSKEEIDALANTDASLRAKIDTLIRVSQEYIDENAALRARIEALEKERP